MIRASASRDVPVYVSTFARRYSLRLPTDGQAELIWVIGYTLKRLK